MSSRTFVNYLWTWRRRAFILPILGNLAGAGQTRGAGIAAGSHSGFAVRGPALCPAFSGTIVSTSANPASRHPARTAFQVRRLFGNGIDYALPGETGPFARPGRIRDAMTDRVIRAG